MSTDSPAMSAGGLLSPALRATTVGALALVSLHAFEALALTTVMPTIARDLQGESLYAMAFTATLAAGIVSIVWSGNLADRRGPRPPLVLGLVLFALGLIGAGLAPTMPVLVGARVVQGLGAGMTSTALYVLVTRIYPPRLHTAILAGFSAAWVVPSIVGPFVAGVIAETIGWRWVFGLAIIVLLGAGALLARIVRGLGQDVVAVPWRWRALVASIVLAVAVLVLNLVAERLDTLAVGLTVLLAVVALAVVVGALLPLLPRGTLLAGRGLPTDVLLRGLAFAAFTGAEVYLPRLLTDRDGFSPSVAGIALTLTGVSWFVGSWVQGAWDTHFEIGRTAAVSLGLMTATLVGLAAAVATAGPLLGRHHPLPAARSRHRHALPPRHGPGPRARRRDGAGLRQLGAADRRLRGRRDRPRPVGHRLRGGRVRRACGLRRGVRRHGRARPRRLAGRPPGAVTASAAR